jgi:hypothetical protein
MWSRVRASGRARFINYLVDVGQRPLEEEVGQHRRGAVARPNHDAHVEVVPLDQHITVAIHQIQTRTCSYTPPPNNQPQSITLFSHCHSPQ